MARERHRIERELAKTGAKLMEREERSYPPSLVEWLLPTSTTVELREQHDDLKETYERIAARQTDVANVFALEVDFTPLSRATIETLFSEFDRLASFDGVADVTINWPVPVGDLREQTSEF